MERRGKGKHERRVIKEKGKDEQEEGNRRKTRREAVERIKNSMV